MFNPLGYLPHLIRNTWSLDILGEELVFGKWHGKKPSEVKLIYSKKQLCPRLTCCSGHWLNWGLQLGIGKREREEGGASWMRKLSMSNSGVNYPASSLGTPKMFFFETTYHKGVKFSGFFGLAMLRSTEFFSETRMAKRQGHFEDRRRPNHLAKPNLKVRLVRWT